MIVKSDLKHILKQQNEEFFNQKNDYLPRAVESQLSTLVTSSNLVKVVLGARRVGKSTLCQLALKDKNFGYVNFDDERLVGLETSDLDNVLEILREISNDATTFYFDEIQNVEAWELFINRLHRAKYNLIITGSNGKLLGKDLATHLTGRQISTIVRPLCFKEFLSWNASDINFSRAKDLSVSDRIKIVTNFQSFFEIGGFPEVVLGEPIGYYLRELFDKIITRDIVQRFKIREAKILKEIALYLVQNSAQKTSYQNLMKAFNLNSISTTRKYVQLLEEVFLICELKGYSYKLTERSTSHRKTYACDLGLMKAVWSKPTIDVGAKLETLIYAELLFRREEVYYLYENKKEVDFCLIKNGKPATLIQVCSELSNIKTREREIKSLVEMSQKYKINDLRIITLDSEEDIILNKQVIKVRPAWMFCLE